MTFIFIDFGVGCRFLCCMPVWRRWIVTGQQVDELGHNPAFRRVDKGSLLPGQHSPGESETIYKNTINRGGRVVRERVKENEIYNE